MSEAGKRPGLELSEILDFVDMKPLGIRVDSAMLHHDYDTVDRYEKFADRLKEKMFIKGRAAVVRYETGLMLRVTSVREMIDGMTSSGQTFDGMSVYDPVVEVYSAPEEGTINIADLVAALTAEAVPETV